MTAHRFRWAAIAVFTLASSLSYLDRQLLAALAPTIQQEFHLSSAEYGLIVSAFSIVYALGAPLSGVFLDRAGLNLGMCLSVGLWSLAGIATGVTSGFRALLGCRAWLGLAESAGIPGHGKANALYLPASERTLGAAMAQIGLSIGLIIAPLLDTLVAAQYGWRAAFVFTGLLGFFWIPAWLVTSRAVPSTPLTKTPATSPTTLFLDRRFWLLAVANGFGMTVYSLWTNWTTKFLVATHHLTQQQANTQYAWMPPVFAAAGGFLGGFLSLRLINRGIAPSAARLRVIFISAIALFATGLPPLLPTPALAVAAVCWSFFWIVAFSSNFYALPLDYFGPERAATGVAALTSAYGLMQTVVSPLIGAGVDHYGFTPVCAAIATLPLLSWIIVRLAVARH